jgi:Zn-dependent peptidase ImmA (M78 family)/DNA-binding XRE family transcriptional regulator
MSEQAYPLAFGFNPDALKLAREFRGLRKNELATMIGVTPSSITQFENGPVRPSPANVAQLSLALRFPRSFFSVSEIKQEITSEYCHFRSLRSCTQIERRKMVSAGNLISSIFRFVEEQGIALPREFVSQNVSHHIATTQDIENAAMSLRREWGLGLGPIGNLVNLLEGHGIIVARLLDDCKGLDAFSGWHEGRPFIFLNTEKESSSRSRFDAAHELGHLIMHTECLPGDKTQEDQANQFASAFLLPRDTFLMECPRRLVWDHFLGLKARWKVSLASLVRRARDLDVLSEDTYKRANVMLGKFGWRTGEPDEPDVEFPTVLPQAIDLLIESGKTFAQIAEAIHFSELDLYQLAYADR